MINILLLFIFSSFFILIYYAASWLLLSNKPIDHVKFYIDKSNYTNEAAFFEKKITKKKLLPGKITKFTILNKFTNYQKKLLFDSRTYSKIEEYIIFKLVIALIGYIVTYVLLPWLSITTISILTLIYFFIPDCFLKLKINYRLKKINSQLIDTLNILYDSTKSGYDFFNAIEVLVNRMDGPIADEFTTVLNEVKLGSTINSSLERLSHRVSNTEFDMVITSILIQRNSLENLSHVLEKITTIIRARITLKDELASIITGRKILAILISLIPLVLFTYCIFFNHEDYSSLITSYYGNILIIISLLMELLGIFFVKKLITIKI